MNHYEELGIRPDATPEEVREAYRLAARLLHPDLQQDPRLKQLAECQMKRLSDVVAVLTDPHARTKYDAEQANGHRIGRLAQLALSCRPERLVRHWFWILLGTMAAGMGVWYGLARSTDAPSGFAAAESARVTLPPPVTQGDRHPVKKSRVKANESTSARIVERKPPPLEDAAVEEPDPTLSATPATPVEPPVEAVAVEPGSVPAVQKTRPADVAASGASRFAGEWLYAADGREEDRAGTYPARYVEFRLRQEGGILAGDYRALHIVLDKAISPEVKLRVRGESPEGSTGKLDWKSSSGATGELELTLRSPNQMQVKWWTTQFGRQEALSSGSAVLVRLKTP